jgi:hypothetical protein
LTISGTKLELDASNRLTALEISSFPNRCFPWSFTMWRSIPTLMVGATLASLILPTLSPPVRNAVTMMRNVMHLATESPQGPSTPQAGGNDESTGNASDWVGDYHAIPALPSADSSKPAPVIKLSRVRSSYKLSPPFETLTLTETAPGVLQSDQNEDHKLYLGQASFADDQTVRIIRLELSDQRYLLVQALPTSPSADAVELTIEPNTPKAEVAETMIGFGDTQIFYRLHAQKVVLHLKIGANPEFPITAKVHVFPLDASSDGIDAWVNNQYSDALFPETAEPSHSETVPASACKVKAAKRIRQSQESFGNFNHYEVQFGIDDCENVGGFTLKAFSDTAKVHIKQ